ncbi:hypothetical protein [Rufibacter roseus]|uniref:Helix-turn-helix domain-containing protein n=1 Tax=Rufibacter roseus TaxID=1567108 RepID=A0ABW2DTQ0_9BACT|nr:hypothetical protein [Rufibacter roseus]
MSLPFLQRSHAYAARLLHKAGLTVSQIPDAVQVTRTTVETWFSREMAKGNAQQAFQVLKGHVQEKGSQMLFEQLKELLLVKLIIHLGIKGKLATNVASLILPFVLKRVYEQFQKNGKLQTWWQDQNWKERLPTTGEIKNSLMGVKKNLSTSSTSTDQAMFI